MAPFIRLIVVALALCGRSKFLTETKAYRLLYLVRCVWSTWSHRDFGLVKLINDSLFLLDYVIIFL